MEADQHQSSSSSFIKQSNPKLIIKFAGRNIIQQQCSKEAEEVKKMSVSKHNLSISNSPKSISNNSDSSLSPTCSICGKSFPSKQSLFGHMRSHPEREWRGIQPPPPPPQSLSVRVLIKNSPASTGSDDSRKSAESSYQGVGPLPVNWSAWGKRGRRPYGSFLSSDERIVDAVKGLLMLKEGNDMDVALMNKQISRETEGIITISKKKKKKRVILESSSSEDVSRNSDLLRSSKKVKIDQERSCSTQTFNNIQEQLPASNLFQEDCGLVKNVSKKVKQDCGLVKNDSKKVKLADERISCGSSRDGFDPKLMNSIHSSPSHLEQSPLNGFHGLGNSVEEVPTSHLAQMYSNGFHGGFSLAKLKLGEMSCSSTTSRDGFDPNIILFLKPAILMKATSNKKKVKEIKRGSSDMGLQGSCSTNEFKCDTCNRTFPTHQALGGHKSSQRNCKSSNSNNQFPIIHHDHQYQYLQCRESMFQAAAEQEYITKTPTTSYVGGGGGTHKCELCGVTFGTGQALGGHKRRHFTGHYTGVLNTSGTVPVNSTTAMAQTEKLIKKEEAQTEKLIKKEEMNRLSVVVAVASSVGGEEVISTTTTTTTTTTKTENKPPVLDFDLNEMPDETPDESWR